MFSVAETTNSVVESSIDDTTTSDEPAKSTTVAATTMEENDSTTTTKAATPNNEAFVSPETSGLSPAIIGVIVKRKRENFLQFFSLFFKRPLLEVLFLLD